MLEGSPHGADFRAIRASRSARSGFGWWPTGFASVARTAPDRDVGLDIYARSGRSLRTSRQPSERDSHRRPPPASRQTPSRRGGHEQQLRGSRELPTGGQENLLAVMGFARLDGGRAGHFRRLGAALQHRQARPRRCLSRRKRRGGRNGHPVSTFGHRRTSLCGDSRRSLPACRRTSTNSRPKAWTLDRIPCKDGLVSHDTTVNCLRRLEECCHVLELGSWSLVIINTPRVVSEIGKLREHGDHSRRLSLPAVSHVVRDAE